MMIAMTGVFSSLLFAQTPAQHVHQADKIRVFYQLAGQYAVEMADVNRNGIPDQIEDGLTQTLAAKAAASGVIPDSPALTRLQALRYTDGTPVLKDLRLTGWRFIREVLQALDQADDIAFSELGYDRWSEENQKSPKNNAYIMRAVTDVMQIRRRDER